MVSLQRGTWGCQYTVSPIQNIFSYHTKMQIPLKMSFRCPNALSIPVSLISAVCLQR